MKFFKNSSSTTGIFIPLVLLSLSISGCGYVTGSITDLFPSEIVPKLSDKVQTTEIVSGSTSQTATLNGYKVNAAIGSTVDQIYLVTPSGYKVYQGVQGQVISE